MSQLKQSWLTPEVVQNGARPLGFGRVTLGPPACINVRNRSVSLTDIVDTRNLYGLGQSARRARLHRGTALETLRSIPDALVHLCVTDPPYFVEGFADEWDGGRLLHNGSEAS